MNSPLALILLALTFSFSCFSNDWDEKARLDRVAEKWGKVASEQEKLAKDRLRYSETNTDLRLPNGLYIPSAEEKAELEARWAAEAKAATNQPAAIKNNSLPVESPTGRSELAWFMIVVVAIASVVYFASKRTDS